MIETRQVSLTTDELAIAFVLCGYDELANQILSNEQLIDSEDKVYSFSKNIEDSLKLKGHWNDNRDSLLTEELENMIKLLALTQLKVRFVTGSKVTFIHKIKNEEYMMQYINNGIHTINYFEGKNNISCIIGKIIKADFIDNSCEDWNPLFLDSDTFDKIHSFSLNDLKKLASGNIAEEMKYFIQDFILNNKEFDNVSCMIMDSKKDVLHVGDVVFYLLGEKNIWFINYEEINEDKIYILPQSYEKFTERINNWIHTFFEQSI